MPGLVGIVSRYNDSIDIKDLLLDMCQVIQHEKWYKTDTFIDKTLGLGRVHLGIFNPESQPIFNQDKTLCIIMEGEIYNYQNMKEECIAKGKKFYFNNDPELILHLYEEYGTDFVHKLNGFFTLAIWNEKTQKLLIVNDRYGFRPLYYTEYNGYLLFGSEIKAILQDKTQKKNVDDRSVADFFSFGYILGNKTFFQGIKLLPPASILTYNEGNISIDQYWDLEFNEEYSDQSEEYYVEKLSKLILQAVERQMKGNHRFGVPLTGGLDSRTIAASIDKKYYPIHTFTFGKPDCDDAGFAYMLSKKLGTTHHFYEFEPAHLASYAEKVVYLTDGMKNCVHAHIYNILDGIHQNVDVIFDGIQGLRFVTPGSELYGADDAEIFSDLFNPLKNIDQFFSDSYYLKIQQYLNHFSDDILINSDINLPFNRYNYYFLKQRKRRFSIFGPIILRTKVETRFPFYENEIMDFILTVPPVLRVNDYLFKKTIITLFPHLLTVPYQKTGLPLNAGNLNLKAHEKIERVKALINSGVRRTIGYESVFKDHSNYADYNNWMRNDKKLREYIYDILLDNRTLERPYFNQEYIKKIIDLHMSGKKNNFELIGRLLTFELWNRQFIDK